MAAGSHNDVPSIFAPWPVKDVSAPRMEIVQADHVQIIYVAIMGGVMLAAFLEWFLFLAAFVYCLVKTFQKAEHWSVRLLSIMVGIAFAALRAIFLPVMVVTLPLPSQVTQYFPKVMVSFLQWFAFWTFAGLLTIPWLFCLYQVITNHIGRKKRIKYALDEHTAPKTVIVMPVYKEDPDVLLKAIDSVVDCDYPPSCLHVFLSFDGDQEDELYLKTIENLGIPLTLPMFPHSIDVIYRNARITVSKFPHGGKRKCQKATFNLIDKIYEAYLKRNDNLFILFIDSDCILDTVCIQNFMWEMELSPLSKRNMLAMTGVITSTTVKKSFITLLQDMEYIHGQLFERTVESACGAVTCLPGALTMLRFSAFKTMAKYYFSDKAEQCDDLFDYGKSHLGEDRWLTHLFMIGATKRYQIQMCTSAFCKTEAVQTYKSLLKQRRRWFLGYITNEACMLTDVRLWRKYPLLCIVRFAQNTIRTTALLFFVMVLSIVTTEQAITNLPVGFIAVSLGLNWALMFYFGAKLKRFKIWLYPVMFIMNPFFNWVYMVYGIFTAGQRTWGGPRADAGAADANTTPQQAIEKAVEEGDDLNVIPETFKPAVAARHPHRPLGGALQPSEHIEGRFAAPERLDNGLYRQYNDSGLTFPNMVPRDAMDWRFSNDPRRGSWDSLQSIESNAPSIRTPRRVESIALDKDLQESLLASSQLPNPTIRIVNEEGNSNGTSSHHSSLSNSPVVSPLVSPHRVPSGMDSRRSSYGPSAPLASGQNSPMYRPSTPSPLADVHTYSPTRQAESSMAQSGRPTTPPSLSGSASGRPIVRSPGWGSRRRSRMSGIYQSMDASLPMELQDVTSANNSNAPRSSGESYRSNRQRLQKRPKSMGR